MHIAFIHIPQSSASVFLLATFYFFLFFALVLMLLPFLFLTIHKIEIVCVCARYLWKNIFYFLFSLFHLIIIMIYDDCGCNDLDFCGQISLCFFFWVVVLGRDGGRVGVS